MLLIPPIEEPYSLNFHLIGKGASELDPFFINASVTITTDAGGFLISRIFQTSLDYGNRSATALINTQL